MKPDRCVRHRLQCGPKPFLSGVLAVLFLFVSNLIYAAAPGETAANFLKIGMGSRGAAMGGAQSAIADDVNAAYWNPAALTRLRFQEVTLMHDQMVEGVKYQYANYGFPTEDKGVFDFGVNLLDYGSIQGYDNNSIPTSNIKASNMLFSGAWAKKPFAGSDLRAGGTLKYLKSDLAGYNASVPMLDLGVLFPIVSGRQRGLSFSGVIRNLGPSIKYDTTSSPLPRQIVLGAGLSTLGGNLNAAVDYTAPKDNSGFLSFGLEYRVFEMLNLRLGYSAESNFVGTGVTYGLGLHFRQWDVDYAFVPYGELGNTNRVSVNFRFGHALQIQEASDQIDTNFRRAEGLYAHGNSVEAYSTLNDILSIAPWHQPSADLKAKIQKQYGEMALSKNRSQLEADISEHFTEAKEEFDRDELMQAKKGFETILALDPTHTGAKVYLERIQNRYQSLAFESFKKGMDYFAAGDYEKAKLMFEKTLTIDETHVDAKAQLETTRQVIADASRRSQEMAKLAGAAGAYKEGLAAYGAKDYEKALSKFEEVRKLVPDYEEVTRYQTLTKSSLAADLFDEAQKNLDRGELDEAVLKLARAEDLNPSDTRIKPSLEAARRDLSTKNAQLSRKNYQDGLEAFLAGNNEKALKLWKLAVELDSTNEDAKKALERLGERNAAQEPPQGQ